MKNFGVDVTIVEFLDRMVPTEDADVSKELLKHYKKLGVKVLLSTKVEGVEDTGPGSRSLCRPRRVATPRCSRLTSSSRRSASRPAPRAMGSRRPG